MKTKRAVHAGAILAIGSFLLSAGWTQASVIYEDIFYWMPDGSTLINPAEGPTDAWVKIQETVYDDAQGKQLLNQQLQLGLIHGSAIPAGPINVYAYSISNLEYDNGPFTGLGLGISGFNIVNAAGVPILGQWGPNAANDWWEVGPNNTGPGNIEWDIDADNDGDGGDGIGIVLGQTHNSFYYAVADGTAHGITDGHWVHSWDTTTFGPEQSTGAYQTDVVYGKLSLPIPEPGTISLFVASAAGLVFVRRRLSA